MRRYPDAKPMGYPFDRPVYQVPTFDKSCTPGSLLCSLKATALPVLEEYVATVSNMEMISVGLNWFYAYLQNYVVKSLK